MNIRRAPVHRVWQTITDRCNVNEDMARTVCVDFKCPPDGLSGDYTEIIDCICDIMGTYVDDGTVDTTDPYTYADKIPLASVDKYLCNRIGTEICTICKEDTQDPTGLSCQGLSCIFCRHCITRWITESCSRCPNCRQHIESLIPIKKAIPKLKKNKGT